MKLLLDTHALLWFTTGDKQLSAKARRQMESSDAELLISAASVWELAIKQSMGRIELPGTPAAYIAEQLASGYGMLAITWRHAAAVAELPWHHRDPFDRLLVAQALVEQLPLVTGDPALRAYGVPIVW